MQSNEKKTRILKEINTNYPKCDFDISKNHQLFSFLLLQYYLSELQKNYFHFKQTSPTAIIKWHFTIPKSIPVYPIIEKPFLALTICQLSFTPTYSNENFCWFTAVGASRAASTPLLNHAGVRSLALLTCSMVLILWLTPCVSP